MEEENAMNRRRSSRSTSKPPMPLELRTSSSEGSSGLIYLEPVVKLSKFQAIQETVVQEQRQATEVTTVTTTVEQTFVQTEAVIESQNRQNQNQEVTKALAAKAAAESKSEKKTRRSVRTQQGSVNGTPKKVKKSQVQNLDAISETSLVDKEDSAQVTSSKSSRATPTSSRNEKQASYSSSSRTRQQHIVSDSGLARKLYEAVQRGEVDTSQSTFMRFYKPVGDWWNYYPKTDNTYSPLSSCRYELAPGMMAMPNLSRRSIQGHHTSRAASSNYRSWFSSVDSDGEDDLNEGSSGTQHVQASTSVVRRVTTSVKRVSVVTVTTVLTVFTLLYSYSIGAVVGLFTQDRRGDTRAAGAAETPLLLRPLKWLMAMVQRFSLLEAWLVSQLGVGQRRNLLLALLLLLLLAVPIYVLYAGGEEKEEDAKETLSWQQGGRGWMKWVADEITDTLLQARGLLATPFAWLSATTTEILRRVLSFIVAPVEWLVLLGSSFFSLISMFVYWLLAPFIWIFSGNVTSETQHVLQTPVQVLVPPKVLSIMKPEYSKIDSDQDIELLARKVLQSEAFKNLQSELNAEFKIPESHNSLLLHLTEELRQLRENMQILKKGSETDQDSKQHFFHTLQREIKNLERQVRHLRLHSGQVMGSRCCDKVEERVAAILAGLFGGIDKDGDALTSADVATLIKTKLSAIENLEERLTKFAADLEHSQQKALEGLKDQIHRSSSGVEGGRNGAAFELQGLSEERVRAIVREALAVYDADKTNMVDYALESSGGTILSTRCTENYDYKHGVTYYFGFSWLSKEYHPNNPRTIIQPNVHPGECWAFKGATGFVVIELSTRVQIMAVTLEHIPRSLAPNGKIDSAPRDFSVWGLTDLMDPEPLLLGKYRYEDNSQPLQTFEVDTEHDSFQKIELRIESNHGHLEYTCVYRFRVHGVPAALS